MENGVLKGIDPMATVPRVFSFHGPVWVLLLTVLWMPGAGGFEIFDGTRLNFPQEFRDLGMRHMCVIYPGRIYRGSGGSRRLLPPEENIRRAARAAAKKCSHAVIDIESWMPKLGRSAAIRLLNRQFMKNYVRFARIWKQENPHTRLGFFNVPRKVDSYPPVVQDPGREPEYFELQGRLLRALRGLVDFGVTSAYWKHDSQRRNARWWSMARSVVTDNLGADTPLYFFVWWRGIGPQYDNSPAGKKAYAWLDSSTWIYILDWMEQNADGVILWSRKGEENPETLGGGPILNRQPYHNWSTAKMLREQQASNYSLLIREAQWIRDIHERLERGSAAGKTHHVPAR